MREQRRGHGDSNEAELIKDAQEFLLTDDRRRAFDFMLSEGDEYSSPEGKNRQRTIVAEVLKLDALPPTFKLREYPLLNPGTHASLGAALALGARKIKLYNPRFIEMSDKRRARQAFVGRMEQVSGRDVVVEDDTLRFDFDFGEGEENASVELVSGIYAARDSRGRVDPRFEREFFSGILAFNNVNNNLGSEGVLADSALVSRVIPEGIILADRMPPDAAVKGLHRQFEIISHPSVAGSDYLVIKRKTPENIVEETQRAEVAHLKKQDEEKAVREKDKADLPRRLQQYIESAPDELRRVVIDFPDIRTEDDVKFAKEMIHEQILVFIENTVRCYYGIQGIFGSVALDNYPLYQKSAVLRRDFWLLGSPIEVARKAGNFIQRLEEFKQVTVPLFPDQKLRTSLEQQIDIIIGVLQKMGVAYPLLYRKSYVGGPDRAVRLSSEIYQVNTESDLNRALNGIQYSVETVGMNLDSSVSNARDSLSKGFLPIKNLCTKKLRLDQPGWDDMVDGGAFAVEFIDAVRIYVGILDEEIKKGQFYRDLPNSLKLQLLAAVGVAEKIIKTLKP